MARTFSAITSRATSVARLIKGYTPDEAIGCHYSTFFSADDVSAGKPQRLMAEAATNGRIADDGWRRRKDGSRFWATAVITALFDEADSVRGYVSVTRDDTQSFRRTACRFWLAMTTA